jgi:predicted nucleic acid-binding Zn ribbon protein
MPFDPAIRQLIATLRGSPHWNSEQDLRLLRALWPKVVGKHLATATSVASVDGARIVIRVPDKTWTRQLYAIRGQLLRKINEPWPNRWITHIGFTYEDKRN